MTRSFCHHRKNGLRPWVPVVQRGAPAPDPRDVTRNGHTLRIFSGRLHSVSFRANGYKGQRFSTDRQIIEGASFTKKQREINYDKVWKLSIHCVTCTCYFFLNCMFFSSSFEVSILITSLSWFSIFHFYFFLVKTRGINLFLTSKSKSWNVC